MDDLYKEELLEAARSPNNKGVLPSADLISSPTSNSCGDSCRVFIQLSDNKERIAACTWEGSGCVISVASLSLLTEQIKGEKVSTIQTWDETTLLSWFGFQDFSQARLKCLLLGLQTLQKLLQKS